MGEKEEKQKVLEAAHIVKKVLEKKGFKFYGSEIHTAKKEDQKDIPPDLVCYYRTKNDYKFSILFMPIGYEE